MPAWQPALLFYMMVNYDDVTVTFVQICIKFNCALYPLFFELKGIRAESVPRNAFLYLFP